MGGSGEEGEEEGCRGDELAERRDKKREKGKRGRKFIPLYSPNKHTCERV